MYGITETTRQAQAAQARRIPFPTDTIIPNGAGGVVCITAALMLCAFFTMTVQITAPMRRKRLPITANKTDRTKPNPCLMSPL